MGIKLTSQQSSELLVSSSADQEKKESWGKAMFSYTSNFILLKFNTERIVDTQICCFILPTTRPEAFLLQPALILTTTYRIFPFIILAIQIRFLVERLFILASISTAMAKLNNFTYESKSAFGCMHFKEIFITENVFLLLCSEQIRFWLLKLIKCYYN